MVVEEGPYKPLIFRQWSPGDELIKRGKLNIYEPYESFPEFLPDVLLCPLVGFTTECNRLGYGGAFYDKTIEKLRISNRALLTIGLAFEV